MTPLCCKLCIGRSRGNSWRRKAGAERRGSGRTGRVVRVTQQSEMDGAKGSSSMVAFLVGKQLVLVLDGDKGRIVLSIPQPADSAAWSHSVDFGSIST